MHTCGEHGQTSSGWREPSRRLPMFVAASLVLHAVIVAMHHDPVATSAVLHPIGSPLIASLIPPAKPTPPAEPSPSPIKKATPEKPVVKKEVLDTPQVTQTVVAETQPPHEAAAVL